MATYKFILDKPKAKGDTHIFLRFYHESKRQDVKLDLKFSTGLVIHPKDWNTSDQCARKTRNAFSEFNANLQKQKTALETSFLALRQQGKISSELIRERFEKEMGRVEQYEKRNKIYLTDFAAEYLEQVATRKSKNTLKHNHQTLRVLRQYEEAKRVKLRFEKIDADFYSSFMSFLVSDLGFRPNTQGKHIANVKLFMAEARDRNLHSNDFFRSKKFQVIKMQSDTIFLNELEIGKIASVDLESSKSLDNARDLFIIGCYTGLRFCDYSVLSKAHIDDTFFKIRVQKTKEILRIPIHPKLRTLLKKYSATEKGLPRKISNAKFNNYIKEVAAKAGITDPTTISYYAGNEKLEITVSKWELITSHTARRSFASNEVKKGTSTRAIMAMTGHKTEKAFNSYVRLSNSDHLEMINERWQREAVLKIA